VGIVGTLPPSKAFSLPPHYLSQWLVLDGDHHNLFFFIALGEKKNKKVLECTHYGLNYRKL
jgi:hypothetical protein